MSQDFCCTEGFYREEEGLGGSICAPEMNYSDEVYCEKCKVKVKKVKKISRREEVMTDRGWLIRLWSDVYVKCPKCKKTGIVDENHHEEDGNYYSCEELRSSSAH